MPDYGATPNARPGAAILNEINDPQIGSVVPSALCGQEHTLRTNYAPNTHFEELDAAFTEIDNAADRPLLTAEAAAIDDGHLLNTPDHWLVGMTIDNKSILIRFHDC